MGYIIVIIWCLLVPAFIPLAVLGLLGLCLANATKPDGDYEE